jgi:hypothetical protein
MWSDTLLAAERSQLIRVVIWAAMSAMLGTTVLMIITLRRFAAPIILAFAIQMVAWGTVELIVAAVRWQSLTMRDVSSATRLDRLTWFSAGLDVGIITAGVVVLVVAWLHVRRLAVIGASLGIIVQGLGLLVLDLTFAAVVARLI